VRSEVVLAVMVLVGPPTGFASAMPDDFNGDDGWRVGAAEKQPLASGDITGACNVLLFVTLSLSSFGGPGHPLNTAAIGDHDGGWNVDFFVQISRSLNVLFELKYRQDLDRIIPKKVHQGRIHPLICPKPAGLDSNCPKHRPGTFYCSQRQTGSGAVKKKVVVVCPESPKERHGR
jgi:hypothetical protein